MKRNMGNRDRAIRTFVVAPIAVVIALVVGAGTAAGIILFAVAGVMVATSAIGYCPLYAPFGLRTCARR